MPTTDVRYLFGHTFPSVYGPVWAIVAVRQTRFREESYDKGDIVKISLSRRKARFYKKTVLNRDWAIMRGRFTEAPYV